LLFPGSITLATKERWKFDRPVAWPESTFGLAQIASSTNTVEPVRLNPSTSPRSVSLPLPTTGADAARAELGQSWLGAQRSDMETQFFPPPSVFSVVYQ
jgi:hypothetical protein